MKNKQFLLILVVIAIVVGGIYFLLPCRGEACKSNNETNAENNMNKISPIEEVREKKAILVDVRTKEEWQAGHADGAIHFDLSRLEGGEMPQIDPNSKIYLYCRSGRRAGEAKALLIQNGFKNVENFGGLEDWLALGGALVY